MILCQLQKLLFCRTKLKVYVQLYRQYHCSLVKYKMYMYEASNWDKREVHSNFHRSRATCQFERHVNEAHVLPLRHTLMDVFKFTKAEPGQNRAYDFCSKTQSEGTDRS